MIFRGRSWFQWAVLLVILHRLSRWYVRWLDWNEHGRSDKVRLADPVLARVGPVDHSRFIFALLYANVAASCWTNSWSQMVPLHLLMLCTRVLAMWLVPLRAPLDTLPLRDPFLSLFRTLLSSASSCSSSSLLSSPGTIDDVQPWEDDMFFSGHTATLTLLCLCATTPVARWAHGVSATIVALALVHSHVHYTLDVLVAPAVCLGWYRLVAHRL